MEFTLGKTVLLIVLCSSISAIIGFVFGAGLAIAKACTPTEPEADGVVDNMEDSLGRNMDVTA